MKSNKTLFLVVEGICIFVVLVCGVLMVAGDRFKKDYRIYAVFEESDNDENQSFKTGMKSAAEEENIELIIVGSEEEIANRGSENIILREKDNKELGVGVGINMVGLDHFALGEALGATLLEDFPEGLKGKNIDVVCNNTVEYSDKARVEGVKKILETSEAGKINVIETDTIKGEWDNFLWRFKGDICLVVDDNCLVKIGESVASRTVVPVIYGIGNSVDSIYLLEKNIIKKIVFPDEYMAGYKSVKEAVKASDGANTDSDITESGYRVLTKDNLYEPENEGILMSLSR